VTVVFDSGVLISALNFGGTPLAALRAAYVNASIAYCAEIENEVRKGLAGKFNWPQANIDEALSGFADKATLIEIARDLKGICRDPKDDMIVECALLANAEFLVSGDRDLLILGDCAGIAIVTPRAFLGLIGET
jgi:putative PIN family toxin of toxin-antitoxin system